MKFCRLLFELHFSQKFCHIHINRPIDRQTFSRNNQIVFMAFQNLCKFIQNWLSKTLTKPVYFLFLQKKLKKYLSCTYGRHSKDIFQKIFLTLLAETVSTILFFFHFIEISLIYQANWIKFKVYATKKKSLHLYNAFYCYILHSSVKRFKIYPSLITTLKCSQAVKEKHTY